MAGRYIYLYLPTYVYLYVTIYLYLQGSVFLARSKTDGRDYAVKRIWLPQDQSKKHRILSEARLFAPLHHQNVVRYFSSWTEVAGGPLIIAQ